MVLSSDATGCDKPAWVHGTAMRSEPMFFPGRDEVNPQAGQDCAKAVYAEAGITPDQLDCAEIYVPFSWYEVNSVWHLCTGLTIHFRKKSEKSRKSQLKKLYHGLLAGNLTSLWEIPP